MTRPVLRRWRLVGLAIVLGLPAAPAPAADAAYSWFPLDSGRRAVFDLERERAIESPSGTAREVFVGEAQVRAGTRHGAVVSLVRLESQTRTGLGLARAPEITQTVEAYSSSREAVSFHGQKRIGGEDREQRYDPPLTFLKAPLEPGRRWQVGEIRQGDLRIQVEAEVVGAGPLTVGGIEHPKALEVRYSGSAAGRVGGQAIRHGRYERRLWLVEGRGPVQERVRVAFELGEQDGTPVTVTDTVTYRLRKPQ